jgi:hypothetical protein
MLSIAAAILTIAGTILRHWLANAPKRREAERHEENQETRQAVVAGDADAVARRIDELREKHRLRQGNQ